MNSKTAQKRIAAGCCVLCGKPNDTSGTRCGVCAEAQRNYQYKRYYKLIADHRCTHCGHKMPEGWYYVTCPRCKLKADKKRWEKKGLDVPIVFGENGYMGIMQGAELTVYAPDGHEVLHTFKCNAETRDDLKAIVDTMPEFIQMLTEGKDGTVNRPAV